MDEDIPVGVAKTDMIEQRIRDWRSTRQMTPAQLRIAASRIARNTDSTPEGSIEIAKQYRGTGGDELRRLCGRQD